MSLRKLPEIRADAGNLGATQFDLRPDALDAWHPTVRAVADDDASISIYDVIGQDWDGNGVTAKRVAAALRNIGQRDVVVNINSPGGDFFEGIAIYNLLRAHQAKVTIQVMGLAASAASVIAMAGDEILMGDGAFLMIHNAWAVAIGNRHDLADAAEFLAPFDDAMAQLYAARAGIAKANAASMMDAETWLSAAQAIEQGFATRLIEGVRIDGDASMDDRKKALAMFDAAMAKAGHSRSARRHTLKTLISGMPGAAEPTMPSAGDDVTAALAALCTTIQSFTR